MKCDNNQWILIIVVICAVFLLSLFGFTGTDRYGMMGGYYGNMMGSFGMGLFGWFFMLLIALALILFIVWLMQQIQEPKKRR